MKVLRLHDGTASGATNNINGWGQSTVISQKAVETITDPQGNCAQSEITSIPSPFARLDLVKQSFKYVNDTHDFDGKTIYHRMVSDALDVGEIFFNINKYGNLVKITEWNVGEIQNFKASTDKQLRLLGKTLELYIQSDAANGNVYNLNNMKSIFILQYTGPGAPGTSALPGHVIGATSPCTLFFTPANDLGYVTNQILFDGNNDRPFDGDYNPLYKRDADFVRYLVWLSKQPGFAEGYPEVSTYISDTITKLNSIDNAFGQELVNMTAASHTDTAPVTTDNGKPVTLAGGYPVMYKRFDAAQVSQHSQLVINATKAIEGDLPLVLPNDHSCDGMSYTTSEWDGSLVKLVPFEDKRELSERILPGINVPYPYLSAGDFLSNNLLYSKYTLSPTIGGTENYVTLGDSEALRHYLLPIRETFFRYFSLADLKRNLKAEKLGMGQIKVTLFIPIKGDGRQRDKVKFERTYMEGKEDSILHEKYGRIVDIGYTGVTILPHMRFPDNVKPDYRITLSIDDKVASLEAQNDLPTLSLVNDSERLSMDAEVCRNFDSLGNRLDEGTCLAKQWYTGKKFTALAISYKGTENLLIPEMKEGGGSKRFVFAVDFGTTNTHIEYAIDGSAPMPFNTTEDDAQLRPTEDMKSYAPWSNMMRADLIPPIIGRGKDDDLSISFPIRTALTSTQRVDWLRVKPLVEANIPLFYERKQLPKYDEPPTTDLKWSNGDEARAQIECFLSELAMMMRNKVLMNNGDLSATKLVWFYPTSMVAQMVGEFSKIWKEVFSKYFDGAAPDQLKYMPEAIAPLPAFKTESSSAITIDVGGGTSDFLFAEGKTIKCISSARFASNSLFGSNSAFDTGDNGFIRYFKPQYEAVSDSQDYQMVIENISKGKNASVNLASFFFSIADNTIIADESIRRLNDFKKKLTDSKECNMVIIIYYMAIAYYAAQVVRMHNLKEPRFIGFSGNGSKIFNIFFDNDPSKKCLIGMTQKIFEHVLGHNYDADGLDLLMPQGDSPKAATAKGGIVLMSDNKGDLNDVDYDYVAEHATTWIGTNEDNAIKSYNDVNDCFEQEVAVHVKDFIDLCQNVLTQCKADKYINLPDNIDKVFEHSAFKRDIQKYVKDGCAQVANPNYEVSSSLFFMPVEGILHKLTNELLFPNEHA